jgi:DNA-binding transcriptional regulator/RsmH inhibitor MraZ
MKIGKLSAFEFQFVMMLREVTLGMKGKDLELWEQEAWESFDQHRPYTLEESEHMEQVRLGKIKMVEPDPESNIPF